MPSPIQVPSNAQIIQDPILNAITALINSHSASMNLHSASINAHSGSNAESGALRDQVQALQSQVQALQGQIQILRAQDGPSHNHARQSPFEHHDVKPVQIKDLGFFDRPTLLCASWHLEKIQPPNETTSNKEENCAMCFIQLESGHKVLVFPCGHYMHADCAWHMLSVDQRCHQCRIPVFDDNTMRSIKADDKRKQLVQELTQTYGIQQRRKLIFAVTKAPIHLLSEHFHSRYGPWKEGRCPHCWGTYQEGEIIMEARCGHYMHYSCAVGVLAETSTLDCGLCATSYFMDRTLISICDEYMELFMQEVQRRFLPAGYSTNTMFKIDLDPATTLLKAFTKEARKQGKLSPRDSFAAKGWFIAEKKYRHLRDTAERLYAQSRLPRLLWDDKDWGRTETLSFEFPPNDAWFPNEELPDLVGWGGFASPFARLLWKTMH